MQPTNTKLYFVTTFVKLKKEKSISVIIPNYNGSILLPQILPPLFLALNNTNLSYEVIISDDCSTDESIVFIETNFPQVKLIKSEINKGFSPTINKGIFAAKYDLLLLLNSDVKLTPHYFEKQLHYFQKTDTFGVMGRIVGWDNDTIQDGGKYPALHGVKIKTSTNYVPKDENSTDTFYSMYLSGANALVSREKIIKLGGFDELFAPFYIEDVELSIRAWRMGWKCYYEHNAICRHKTSTTIKTKESKRFINTIYYRNKMFLHALHLQKATLFLWYLQLVPEALIHLVTGRLWYFKALKQYFASKNLIKHSRKVFARLQKDNNIALSVKDIILKIRASLKEIKKI